MSGDIEAAEAERAAAAMRRLLAALEPAPMPRRNGGLHEVVEAAWVKAFGQSSWDEGRAFDEAGSDSLLILGVIFDIERALGVRIPADIVSNEMTPRDLIAAVSRLAAEPVAAAVRDDRPEVFLCAAGVSRKAVAALRDGLATWLRLIVLPAVRRSEDVAEQILRSDPTGAINVIACGGAPVVPAAVERLARLGYRPGFTMLLEPAELRTATAEAMQSICTRIFEAFVAGQTRQPIDGAAGACPCGDRSD